MDEIRPEFNKYIVNNRPKMKHLILIWTILILPFIGLPQEYVTDVPARDPVLIREGNTYYMFSTGPGIAVWSSKNLKEWKRLGRVFEESPLWVTRVAESFNGHFWAPDISYQDGMYYLYYTVSAFGKNTSAIGLATNKALDPESPDFKWEDQGIVVQSVPGRDLWNAIDPNLAFDDEGTPWLTYGSYWNGMKLVRLADDLKTVQNGPEDWYTIARRERSFQTDDRKAGDAAIEAPFIFKKNGYYYLFVSFDHCCRGVNSTYKVAVGRSEDIKGPYLDKSGTDMFHGGGTIVVQGNADWHGVGHNSVYTFDGVDYIAFHGYDASDEGKAKLVIRSLYWDDKGWPVVDLSE